MANALIIISVIMLTLAGDYFIKLSSFVANGLWSPRFLLGALLYGLSAIGWFYLMRSHTLAVVAVLYSSSTLILLAGLGALVFREPFGTKELLGLGLAFASLLVMTYEA